MPPRSSKRRGGSAKRGAPKRKRETLKAADEDSEQLVEESVAVKKEVDDAEEVTVEKVPETVESLETDREALVTKEEEENEEEDPEEETVVEETKLVEVVAKEEIVERDGSNDVVNVEETEENELVGDAERDETEPEEDDEIEPEEDDDEIDPEEEDAEIEPEEDTVDDLREKMADIDNHVGEETGPKEDTIEDLGEKMTDIDNHLGEASDGIARDNGNSMDEQEVDESGSDPEDEEDSSLYQQAPLLADHKKPKELEIFVGGLDRMAVEEDLIKVFGGFGDIQAVRIVKHPVTQKSKGFAFIRYATPEQARKVLADLKDGTEVKGKRVGISLSQETDTLYMGNICKTWTREQAMHLSLDCLHSLMLFCFNFSWL
ncbi:hypothetical protein Syun_013104 [Stephania yunnanensis]|uniref:RRM domain-containing protein n=1 Tax=Stephania yunnanensis TaxID=152371 RepID=A0AAP0K1E5_9MAGN